jgi:hypothetical protein
MRVVCIVLRVKVCVAVSALLRNNERALELTQKNIPRYA